MLGVVLGRPAEVEIAGAAWLTAALLQGYGREQGGPKAALFTAIQLSVGG